MVNPPLTMPEGTRVRLTRRRLGGPAAAAVSARGVLAGLLGAACAAPGGEAPVAARGGGELRFFSWQPAREPALEPVYRAYEARTGTKITLEAVVAAERDAKLTAAFAADSAWDVLVGRAQTDSPHYDAGHLMDLTERWKRDRFSLGDYALMYGERWCDKAYGMPSWVEPFAVFYNKSLLRQSGVPDPWDAPTGGDWTWDDLVRMARRVTVPPRDDQVGTYGIWWPYDNPTYFGPNVWTFGGDHVDFASMRWALDSPVAAEAYQRFAGWVGTERIAIAVGSPDWNAIARTYPGLNPFLAGRAAFWFRSVNEVHNNQAKIGSNFEWDVLPVPRQGSRQGVAVTSGHPNSVWARTRLPDQAYDFARFLAGPEAQEHMGRLRLSMPALKAKMGSFLEPRPVPHVQVFTDVFRRPRGMHFRHHTVLENWDQYAKGIAPLVAGERPLADGLRELNRQMNERVRYGSCAPYKGMTHPLPANAG